MYLLVRRTMNNQKAGPVVVTLHLEPLLIICIMNNEPLLLMSQCVFGIPIQAGELIYSNLRIALYMVTWWSFLTICARHAWKDNIL